MGVLFSTIRGTLNILLPFTNPQTPLLQDLIHTGILCGTLYYAPQIAEYYKARNLPSSIPVENNDVPRNAEVVDQEDILLEPDNDAERIEGAEQPLLPPLAQRIQNEEEEQQWQNENDFAPGLEAGPGPANININERPRPTAANRTVGAKKAKSLARRDQRRAYHEFHRSQAEQRRLAEEAGREEREKALSEEKLRRAEEERRIAEKLRGERDKRKEEERREMEKERERRERTIARVRDEMERRGTVDLGEIAARENKDRIWIERLVRASGIVEKLVREREGCRVFFTGEGGWLVRLDAELMASAYEAAVRQGDHLGGKVSFAQLGDILQKTVLANSHGVA